MSTPRRSRIEGSLESGTAVRVAVRIVEDAKDQLMNLLVKWESQHAERVASLKAAQEEALIENAELRRLLQQQLELSRAELLPHNEDECGEASPQASPRGEQQPHSEEGLLLQPSLSSRGDVPALLPPGLDGGLVVSLAEPATGNEMSFEEQQRMPVDGNVLQASRGKFTRPPLAPFEDLAAWEKLAPSHNSRLSNESGSIISAEITLTRGRRSSRGSLRTRESSCTGQDHVVSATEPDPDKFDLLPFWTDRRGSVTQVNRISRLTPRGGATPSSMIYEDQRRASMITKVPRIVISPVSKGRLVWEILGALCIVYDLVMMPLQVFALGAGTSRIALVFLTVAYWTLDVPASFFVGYHVNGYLELRGDKTCCKYMRTWFIPDVVLLTCDWVVLWMEHISDGSVAIDDLGYLRAARGVRLLRFFGLLRVLKMWYLFGKMTDSIHSEHALTAIHVGKLVVMILTLNHFVACSWYLLGSWDDGKGWPMEHFQDRDSAGYRYFTSLHWSLTQFTPATMEVMPTNLRERIFSVWILVLAMVVFSSFISSITEATTKFRKINGQRTSQKAELRQYFGENRVSAQLAVRVWRYLEQDMAAGRRQRKLWNDVELFSQLPPMLQMDLQTEVYLPTICRHPFFYQYHDVDVAAMRAVCHKAILEVSLVKDQDLFSWGQVADSTHFLVDGTLAYTLMFDADTIGAQQAVSSGTWISEAALFVRWFHHGTLNANEFSILFKLVVDDFFKVLEQYTEMLPQCRMYARLFRDYINQDQRAASDISGDFDMLQDLAQQAFDNVHRVELHGSTGAFSSLGRRLRRGMAGGLSSSGSFESKADGIPQQVNLLRRSSRQLAAAPRQLAGFLSR